MFVYICYVFIYIGVYTFNTHIKLCVYMCLYMYTCIYYTYPFFVGI